MVVLFADEYNKTINQEIRYACDSVVYSLTIDTEVTCSIPHTDYPT